MYKKFISFIIVVIIILSPTQAQAQSKDNKEKSEYTSEILGEIINLILEDYLYNISAEELYQGAVYGMSLMLDDYSEYLSYKELLSFISDISSSVDDVGIIIGTNESGYYVSDVTSDSPAKKSGVLKGDVIEQINDKSIKELTLEQVYKLLMENIEQTKLLIQRNDKKQTFIIKKDSTKYSSVAGQAISGLIPNAKANIGYISISIINDRTAADLNAMITYLKSKGIAKVVLDLRNNPGGLLEESINICNLIIPKGVVVSTVNKKGEKQTHSSLLEKPPFEDIIVLTNHNSASAAEIIASALQDTGSKVIGQTTYGKGVVQELFVFTSGDGIKLTTMEYRRRNGGKIDGIGVIPDIVVVQPMYIYSMDNLDTANFKALLNYIGYKTEEGDKIGTVTTESLKEFQKANAVAVTGVLNPETVTKLNKSLFETMQKNDIVLKKAYETLTTVVVK